jgi:hypothetical protein
MVAPSVLIMPATTLPPFKSNAILLVSTKFTAATMVAVDPVMRYVFPHIVVPSG